MQCMQVQSCIACTFLLPADNCLHAKSKLLLWCNHDTVIEPRCIVQVQTIGFISHLRQKDINGPFMVVGPLSTLSNWVDEFKRWLPSMNVILYHGSKDERQKLRNKHMPHGELHSLPFSIRYCWVSI